MKKNCRIAIILMISAMAVTLTACGNEDAIPVSGTVVLSTVAAFTRAAGTTSVQTSGISENNMPEGSAAEKNGSGVFRADSAKIKYNGSLFGVGDNMKDIKGKLGTEAAPATDAPSCLNGKTIKEYYYNGMTIQATDTGIIFSVTLTDDLYPGGNGSTENGIKLGDSVAAVQAICGDSTESQKSNLIYKDGTISMQITFSARGAEAVWITDTSIEGE